MIDTITAKNTGSDLTDFVVCYPEHLASRISLIKVRGLSGNATPACNCTHSDPGPSQQLLRTDHPSWALLPHRS